MGSFVICHALSAFVWGILFYRNWTQETSFNPIPTVCIIFSFMPVLGIFIGIVGCILLIRSYINEQ